MSENENLQSGVQEAPARRVSITVAEGGESRTRVLAEKREARRARVTLRRRVTKLRNTGLRADLGPEFPGVEVGIKSLETLSVMNAVAEYQRWLQKNDPGSRKQLSADAEFEILRFRGLQVVAWLDGEIEDISGNPVKFTREAGHAPAQQFLERNYLFPTMPLVAEGYEDRDEDEFDSRLLSRLLQLSQDIDGESDEEIGSLGEGWKYGQKGARDSAS